MTPTFTCDVVDYSTGSAPTGMQVFFKCQQSSWERNTFRGSVDSAGHVTRWIFSGSDKNLPIGSFIEHNDGRLWVLVFDTGRYYSSENISFPTVEIHFYLRKGDQMHMSLRVGPHSYTCGRSLENARITSPPTLLKSQIPPLYFPYTCFPATSSKPEVLGPLAHPSPKRLKTPHQPSRVISRHPNQILDSLSSEEKARGRPLRLIWNTFQINLLEKYFHYDPFPNGPSRSQIGNRLHAHKDHVEVCQLSTI
jgi:5-hydroxyisourate hydrolase-like protein (transthyretin family)